MKSLPFYIPEAWKRYPFRAEPPRIGHYREYPPPGISSVSKKVSSGIGIIKKIKPFVPTSNLISVYQSILSYPVLSYPILSYPIPSHPSIPSHPIPSIHPSIHSILKMLKSSDMRLNCHQRLFWRLIWMSAKDAKAGNDRMVIPDVYECLAQHALQSRSQSLRYPFPKF